MHSPRETLAGCAGMTAGLAADCLSTPAVALLSLCSGGDLLLQGWWLHLQTMPMALIGMMLGKLIAGGTARLMLATLPAMMTGLPWAPSLADAGLAPFVALTTAMVLPMFAICGVAHILRQLHWLGALRAN